MRIKQLFLVACIVMIGTSCGQDYQFYDVVVKETIADYLDKEVDELTQDDLDALTGLEYFVIKGTVNSLNDIPALMPNIKYLNVTFGDQVPENVGIIIASLANLTAVTIEARAPIDAQFAENLPYVEITYGERLSKSSLNNLHLYSVLDGVFILEQMDKPLVKYLRVVDGDDIYELISSGSFKDNHELYNMERKVLISNRSDKNITCETILDFTSEVGFPFSNRLYLCDVDFDGSTDVLVDKGYLGTGARYSCYLNNNGQYRFNESFEQILNPAFDTENKRILAAWCKYKPVTHCWARYTFIEDSFVMTEEVTDEMLDGGRRNYTLRKYIDGSWQETPLYTLVAYYAEGSDWDLRSDKWETVYRMGSYKYKDDRAFAPYIDKTILDIINQYETAMP